MRLLIISFTLLLFSQISSAATNVGELKKVAEVIHKKTNRFTPVNQKPFFDIPVTYNKKVRKWIKYFQTTGKKWFKSRLERSYKYLPLMQNTLRQKGLPQDLAYIAMIESGFSPHAVSSAKAVGYWQFIKPTANRYGLETTWWLDERRDFVKSTVAAANYIGDLYKDFGSWYLAAAGYNMGETRLRRLIRQHKTDNYWVLSEQRNFPNETRNYIPKMIAALLISKAPGLYGFRDIQPMNPYRYEYFHVPGGTDLFNLSKHLGISRKKFTSLNPELVLGFVPGFVEQHRIRIPKGLTKKVSKYVRTQL